MAIKSSYICDICGEEFVLRPWPMKELPEFRKIIDGYLFPADNLVTDLCDKCWKTALSKLREYYEFIDCAKVNRVARYAKEEVRKE